MKIRALAIVCALVLVAPMAHAFSSFDWTGLANAHWVTPSNWTEQGGGGGTFVNDAAHSTDVCYVGAGGSPKDTLGSWNNTTFYPQLNLASGATLDLNGFRTDTINDLQLNGGTVTLGSAMHLNGNITVNNTSTLNIVSNNNDDVAGTLSGSGGLDVKVASSNTLKINTNNSAYTGMITFKGGGGYTELTTSAPNAAATLRFEVGNVRISANTSCDWELATSGQVTVTRKWDARTHTGQFTLESDAILAVDTDYNGKHGTLNGKITGTGKLTSRSNSSKRRMILGSSLNDYSGGTRVDTGALEATTTSCLGTGNVQVDPGTQLIVGASETIDDGALLFLDYNGATSYGKISLGAGTTTTVYGLLTGGLGGWDAPVGYTSWENGIYTASTPGLENYLTGTGTLVVDGPVPPIAEPAGLGLFGLALLGLKRKRS